MGVEPRAGARAPLAMAERQSRTEPDNLARVRGSRTAELVAAARAAHFARAARPLVVEDPYAIHLAGGMWQRVIGSGFLYWLVTSVALRKVLPTMTYVLVRARFCDDRVLAAVERGVRQLVILGAGFDTFALRYSDLGIEVFEVDLPASGALKRERMAAAGLSVPKHLRFVEVDFERDDLGARLVAAGFDPRQRTLFSWMGVTFYLTLEAVTGTLDRIGVLAAPGSELALDYMQERECVPEEELELFDRMLRFVKRHGEPMITSFAPDEAVERMGLREAWETIEHEFPAANPDRHLGSRKDLARVAPLYRLLHLRRSEEA